MQNNANLLADVSGKPRLADRIIQTLVEFGVRHVFMMPAETINALYDAARRNPEMLAVLVRHEGNGALMASAYAKLGGTLAVVIGAGGPGATHLPIGAYDAKGDHVPLLLIAGQVPLNQLGAGSFQELDTLALFADSAAQGRLVSSELQSGVVAMLCADAVLRRRPTHLAVAQDVLTRPVGPTTEQPGGPRAFVGTPVARPRLVERCARLLAGEGPAAIVVGAVDAEQQAPLIRIARWLGVPLVIAPEGLHLLREPPAWPCLRLAGPWRAELRARTRAARRVLSVGPTTDALRELLPSDASVVHLVPATEQQAAFAARGPRLCGELNESLSRLATALERLGPAREAVDQWAAKLARAQAEAVSQASPPPPLLASLRAPEPCHPGDAVARRSSSDRPGIIDWSIDWTALDRALPPDAIVTVEPGPLLDELFLALPLRERIVSSSFNHGARGYALPAAIGAALARPERRAVALATPTGLAESMAALLTAARYGLAVVVLCLDADAGPIDFAEYTRALGLPVELGEGPEQLADALERALSHRRPALVSVRSNAAPDRSSAAPACTVADTQSPAPATLSFAAWLVEALARAGVDRVYGSTRGQLGPLVDAIARHDTLALIEPCHQESASMMASARAKHSRRLAVCFAADMSDLVQLLNGLYDACFDHAPVLVLTPRATSLVDPARLLGDVARASATLEPGPAAEARLEQLIAEGLRARTVVHAMLDWEQLEHATVPLGVGFDPVYTDDELHPDEAALAKAVARLREAERPVLLVGRGAAGARADVVALAERLHAPIVTSFPGRAVIPPSDPSVVGCVGSSGHRAAEQALQWADLVVILGSSSRGSVFYRTAFPTHFTVVQIDEDPLQLARRKPDSVDLCGSVAPTVRALLERLGPAPTALASRTSVVPRLATMAGIERVLGRVSSQRIDELDDGVTKRVLQGLSDLPVGEAARAAAMKLQGTDRGPLRALMRERFERWIAGNQRFLHERREPIAPPAIALALQAALAQVGPATITVDVGVSTLWLFRYLTSGDHELIWTSSFATMGFAVPAAVAVAEAGGKAPVVAWTGDGGVAITLAELASATRRELPLVVVVVNNGSMAAVKWELEVMGWPDLGSRVHDCDFARYARACGARGVRVTKTEALTGVMQEALREAVAERRPCLVDVVCDPDYGPFPPKIHYSQGFGYAVALAREAALKLRGEGSS